MVIISGARCTGSPTDFRMTFRSGSYLTTGYLAGATVNLFNSTTLRNDNATTFCYMAGTGATHLPLSSDFYNATVWLYNIQNAGATPSFYGTCSYNGTGTSFVEGEWFGTNTGTAVIDGVKFATTGTTWAVGEFKLYGVTS